MDKLQKRGPRWTSEEHERLVALRANGQTYRAIATTLRRTECQVRYRVESQGLTTRKARDWTSQEEARVADLLDRHKGYHEIAMMLGRSVGAVEGRCGNLGLSPKTANGETVKQVSCLLGVDSKAVAWWCNKGWLCSHTVGMALCRGEVRVVERDDLLGFLENPDHWHLWEPHRITDWALREHCEDVRRGVRFLTTAEVGDRLCLTHFGVNKLIRAGKLKAVKHGPNWLVREDWCEYPAVRPRASKRGVTAGERAFVREHWPTHTGAWIGVRLGRESATVHKMARDLGLPRKGRGAWKKRSPRA